MLNFEKKIQERIRELEQMEAERAATAELERIQTEEKEVEDLARERKVVELGKEVVRLLDKHNVEPLAVWRTASSRIGKPVRYDNSGSGWHIYTSIYESGYGNEFVRDINHVGIDTNGTLLRFHETSPPIRFNQSIHGIINPHEMNTYEASPELTKSHAFQLGVASLISTGRPYTTHG